MSVLFEYKRNVLIYERSIDIAKNAVVFGDGGLINAKKEV